MGISGAIFSVLFMLAINLGGIELPDAGQLNDPVFLWSTIALNIVNTLVSTFLVVAGIGLLRTKRWGRSFSNVYAVLSFLVLIATLVFQVVVVIIPAWQNTDPSPEAMSQRIGATAGLVGFCFAPIYPICVLYFLNRKKFVADYEHFAN